jgi:hypothetical protein
VPLFRRIFALCIFAQIVKISEDFAPVAFCIVVESVPFHSIRVIPNDVENAVASRFGNRWRNRF